MFKTGFKLPRRHKVRGTTLTEIAIVLGIFGLIIGALWGLAGTVMKYVRREQFSEQVVLIVRNVRSYYMGQSGITGTEGVLTPSLVAKGLFPKEMVAGTAVMHPWGIPNASYATGTVFVSQNNASGDDQKFNLAIKALDSGVCISVARHLTSAGPTGLVEAKVNGAKVATPLSVSAAKAACGSALNSVTAVYKLRISTE